MCLHTFAETVHYRVSVSTLTRDSDIAILSVCLSIRLSITFRYILSKWLNISLWFLSRVSILTRDIDIANLAVLPSVCPLRSGIRWKRLNIYLANDARYRHSYYGRRIETRMRSIKWCHFQWPWTNPNPVFKVTSLFDAKYLTNGYRYGHSYYTSRIGNRAKAFEWHQFQWPRVTSNPDFKVTILFNVK